MTVLLVGAGGFLGAISRYALDSWITGAVGARFPWGILAVNLSGSFVAGLLFAISVERGVLPESLRAPILIGFIGAYTTFSTLTLDSWRLVEAGHDVAAFANLAGSIVLGLVAVLAGLTLGRAI